MTYKMRLIKLEHPGTIGYMVSNLANQPEVALSFFGILMVLIFGVWQLRHHFGPLSSLSCPIRAV